MMLDESFLSTPVYVALISVIVISGCLSPKSADIEEANKGECETYPDRAYLRETWSSQVNNTQEGYDAVAFGISTWGLGEGEEEDERPDRFVNWTEYPEADRPQILSDIVCYTLGRLQGDLTPPFASRTPAPKHIGDTAMGQLENEFFRQNGVREETCCYLWMEGQFYGVGYSCYHKTWLDGSSSTGC